MLRPCIRIMTPLLHILSTGTQNTVALVLLRAQLPVHSSPLFRVALTADCSELRPLSRPIAYRAHVARSLLPSSKTVSKQMSGSDPALTFQQMGGTFDDLLRKVLEPSVTGRGFFVADVLPRGEILGLGFTSTVGETGTVSHFVMIAPSSSGARFATLTLPRSANSKLRAIVSSLTRLTFLPMNTNVIRLEFPSHEITDIISVHDLIEIRGSEGDPSIFLCPFSAVSWEIGEEEVEVGIDPRDDIDPSAPTPELEASMTGSSEVAPESETSEISVPTSDIYRKYWWMVGMMRQLFSSISSYLLAALSRGSSIQLSEEEFSDMTSGDLSDEDLGPDPDETQMEETDEMEIPSPASHVRPVLS